MKIADDERQCPAFGWAAAVMTTLSPSALMVLEFLDEGQGSRFRILVRHDARTLRRHSAGVSSLSVMKGHPLRIVNAQVFRVLRRFVGFSRQRSSISRPPAKLRALLSQQRRMCRAPGSPGRRIEAVRGFLPPTSRPAICRLGRAACPRGIAEQHLGRGERCAERCRAAPEKIAPSTGGPKRPPAHEFQFSAIDFLSSIATCATG